MPNCRLRGIITFVPRVKPGTQGSSQGAVRCRLRPDESLRNKVGKRVCTVARHVHTPPSDAISSIIWGISTVGSALHSHCRGQRFESAMLHQKENPNPISPVGEGFGFFFSPQKIALIFAAIHAIMHQIMQGSQEKEFDYAKQIHERHRDHTELAPVVSQSPTAAFALQVVGGCRPVLHLTDDTGWVFYFFERG